VVEVVAVMAEYDHLEVEMVDPLHRFLQMNPLVVVNLVIVVVEIKVAVEVVKALILPFHLREVAVEYFGFDIQQNTLLFQTPQGYPNTQIMEHTKYINGTVQEVGHGIHQVLIQHHKTTKRK
jgi:hypothetical protein